MDKIKEYETVHELYLDIPKGGIGAEIGVCKGVNAISLYHLTKPKKFHLCDIWRERHPNACLIEYPCLWEDDHRELVGRLFKREIEQGTVELHREYGGNFLYGLENDYLDWIYIDACHDYKSVSIEIENALHKVKKGGFIMGHDYVTNCQVWKAGVIRAVNEHIQAGKIKMVGISIERYPSYLCEVL
tara:strand:- start:276 stop:836 length:561 start_codon:yes stop_codon:yes gene_type:complete